MRDHARGCEGREYTCTCGYDDARDALVERLAKAVKDHPENSALGSTVRQIFALAAKEQEASNAR